MLRTPPACERNCWQSWQSSMVGNRTRSWVPRFSLNSFPGDARSVSEGSPRWVSWLKDRRKTYFSRTRCSRLRGRAKLSEQPETIEKRVIALGASCKLASFKRESFLMLRTRLVLEQQDGSHVWRVCSCKRSRNQENSDFD